MGVDMDLGDVDVDVDVDVLFFFNDFSICGMVHDILCRQIGHFLLRDLMSLMTHCKQNLCAHGRHKGFWMVSEQIGQLLSISTVSQPFFIFVESRKSLFGCVAMFYRVIVPENKEVYQVKMYLCVIEEGKGFKWRKESAESVLWSSEEEATRFVRSVLDFHSGVEIEEVNIGAIKRRNSRVFAAACASRAKLCPFY
jgi:hypothetical protein